MGEATIDKILKSFELTETEIEVYIFLAKHGILKCSQIAAQMKKDRAQALRILKSLQTKGLVEATLESPTRYVPVPFEQLIDLSIKAKKDEAALIESARNELLNYWKKIEKKGATPSPERFLVIEGDHKVFHKINQMITETKNQLSSILSVSDLMRGDQLGLFESMLNHPLKSKVHFHFLTEVSNQNIKTVKSLFQKSPKTEVNIKGRNPDLGIRLFPRMVIRDNEEIIFFIKPKNAEEKLGNDHCLWTNCTDLVQAFTGVFEDLWRTSTDIQTKIVETITQAASKAYVINDKEVARKKYNELLYLAKKEIVMITSSRDLVEVWNNKQLLNGLVKKCVSVKVMVPLTSENKDVAQKLSKHFAVRHVPLDYLAMTIIDDKHLFQFKSPQSVHTDQESHKSKYYFENTFYTDDSEYVKKTKNLLDNIWKNANPLSPITLANVFISTKFSTDSNLENTLLGPVRKVSGPISIGKQEFEKITEEDVLRKIINAQKNSNQTNVTTMTKQYGFTGQAIINPPKSIDLPNMLIYALHYEKQSTFGAMDALLIHLWLKTPKGYAYVPVAFAHDNSKTTRFYKKLFGNISIQLLGKDEIQIQLHGKNFFCGWTAPISLTPNLRLNPSSILLEGTGNLKSGSQTFETPSSYRIMQEFNGFEAFVTFFHPTSKYSGPGTDGFIGRDVITTICPI